jgi:hypothetical protein
MLAGGGRTRDLGWGWMLFWGRYRVDWGVCACGLGKKAFGMLRPSNSVCCSFRFVMFILARRTLRLFNPPSAYITPPTLISFSYLYLCVNLSSYFFFLVFSMIWFVMNVSGGFVLTRPPISFRRDHVAGHDRDNGELIERCPNAAHAYKVNITKQK